MRPSASKSWRKQGDAVAFDHTAWEFKARQFYVVGKRLVEDFEVQIKSPSFDAIMALATGEFVLCLALELTVKAHYLKAKTGHCEAIYDHDVLRFVPDGLLTDAQRSLLKHAVRYVIWAGRYPTPKWTTEHYKEGYDADALLVEGIETIDGSTIPNSASLQRSKELVALCEELFGALARLPDN